MKIEELTAKIYEEGVAKARQQGDELVSKSREEADKLLAEAKDKARDIVEKAESEAEQKKARIEAELHTAAEQALDQLRNRIVDALVDSALPKSVGEALADADFVRKLIDEVVTRWDASKTSVDVEVVLPEALKKETAGYFSAKAGEALDKGLDLSFSPELKGRGFQIRSKDGSYRISFLEEDFISFFRPFLRERTRSLLFPAHDKGSGR